MATTDDQVTMDDYLAIIRAKEGGSRRGSVTFLPEPVPYERKHTIISVDDHLVEPPDMFEGRLPSKFDDRVPRIVEKDGGEHWLFEDNLIVNVGFNATAGRPTEEWSMEPTRFSEMRRGCWDIHARVKDMDLDGVQASLNFPSFLAGFAGTKFSKAKDQEFGLAVTRAWNDWHIEEWAAPYPDRIIPVQITWLSDPEIAAQEIRKNAERGFKAVSFSEDPTGHGLPSIYSRHWDPFLAACEETDTVVCLHIGSSTRTPGVRADAPLIVPVNVLLLNAYLAAADWVWSEVPLRFPNIKIAMSEGGASWVLSMFDRLNYVYKRHAGWALEPEQAERWKRSDVTPAEAFLRNFWFCTFDDPSAMRNLDVIGAHNVMLESDYPHSDGTWPHTQAVAEALVGHLPREEAELITYKNASRLFRHEVPAHIS
ncbi:MAG: hypothetical protein QOI95_1997 [Acidimicrobiaceae bacterium]|jgi:predicted TIM-barrel fold metal-dependent hydrolase